MVYASDFWTKDSDVGAIANGLKVDFKGDAFNKKDDFKVRLQTEVTF